jgi:hypothetical protein
MQGTHDMVLLGHGSPEQGDEMFPSTADDVALQTLHLLPHHGGRPLEPVRDAEHILKYLARYTHRVAISNHRLVALQEGEVTFRFKDSKRRGEWRTQTLKAVEFLRRFTLHILPPCSIPAPAFRKSST